MRRSVFIILFCVVLSVSWCGVCAQTPSVAVDAVDAGGADSVRVHRIDGVVAVARQLDRAVIPAQVLAGDELRRLSSVSVADAIRYFSGVQIKDYGGMGGLKTVNIRSMGTHHVGVFYDGVQIGNAQNGTVDLGRFSMDNMEAIALHNGQKSEIFQSAKDFASAGAIYMTARRPIFEAGRRHNVKLALKGGSFGTVNPSALWEARLARNLDVQLGTEYMYTTGRYRFSYRKQGGYDTTEMRHNGDVRVLRVEGGLFGRLGRGDWRAKIYFYDSERGYPGAVVATMPGSFVNEDRQWDANFFVQGTLRQTFGRYRLMLNAKYADDRLRYLQDVSDGRTPLTTDNHYRQREGYLSVANEFTIADWWRLSLSADALANALGARMSITQDGFATPRRLTTLASAATCFEWRGVSLQLSGLYTHVADRVQKPGAGADHKDEWTPTAVMMWRPLRKTDLSIRAFYKRIFRMPTFNDLYYTQVGAGNLDPERTTQYNLGAVWSRNFAHSLLRRIGVQLDGYFNRVTDKIVAMPTSNQFRWTMINTGYVEIRGVDAAVQAGLRLGAVDIDTRLVYTWQKAQDLTDRTDEWYGDQIPYIPWHSGSTAVGATWRDWSLNYSFIYTGQRYEARANTLENWTPPWYTHDMSLGRALGAWRFTAEINNLFNQQYEVVQRYPMPGINFRLKIEWTL
jgi:outer membrane cobalamin receptor